MEGSKDYQHLQSSKGNASSFIPQVVELKFSVPWGHIAAKAWGDPRGEPILAVHGIDDNAATFDTLIPLLLQLVGRSLYVVSVDLPGHGHSSPLAPGIPYRFTDLFGSLRRVVNQLGWHKFHYLGHSLGGIMGYYFAASYPDLVEKLIVFDVIGFKMYPVQYHSYMLRALGEKLLAFEKKCEMGTGPLTYTLNQALHKLVDGRGTKMTENGIRALASRNLTRVEGHENLYRFSRDQRIKCFNLPVFYEEEAVQIMSQVKCQLLLVTGNESLRVSKHSVSEAMVNAVAKGCSYFKHYVVNGDHDVHLNFPERVAPLVVKFLCGPVSSLCDMCIMVEGWGKIHYLKKIIGVECKPSLNAAFCVEACIRELRALQLGNTWGDPCGQPVLCVHGIQDNAGTFNHLIPLLPSTFHYVCIDLPGHGYSSPFPEGLPLDFTDYVLVLVRILNHLQWESCYYIGHSLGGQLGMYLCSLWPQRIKKLVLLDAIGPMYTKTDQFLSRNKLILDNVLSTEELFSSKMSPSYTYKEALDRILTNRNSKLTKEAAKVMIQRSLMKNSDGGFRFTTDQRLKIGLWPLLNHKQQLQIFNDIKCPVLAVLVDIPKLAAHSRIVEEGLKLFNNKQNFQRIDVKGNHDAHINNPERIAPYIVKFLTTQKCTL